MSFTWIHSLTDRTMLPLRMRAKGSRQVSIASRRWRPFKKKSS
jgi:hypothetical protein